MLTDDKIWKIVQGIGYLDDGDNMEKFARAIEQAARAEALEEAADLCKENAEKWYKSDMEKQHFIGAAIGADKCQDAIRALINKEQAQ